MQLIGIHAQGGTDEEILKPIKAAKIKYPIAKSGSGPLPVTGIPHMFVFDAAGKLAWQGHGAGDAEKAIRKALKDVKAGGAGAETAGSSSPTPSASSSSTPAAPAVLIPERSWTNADGKQLTAALLGVSGDDGNFRRRDGTKFSYPLTKLVQADQDAIQAALKSASEAK